VELIARRGGKESNSLITLAEAEEYLLELPDDTSDWDDLEEYEKFLRLIMAARLMLTLPLRGYKAYEGQAMCFPRYIGGVFVDTPDEAKQTQAFIAYSVVHRGLANRIGLDEVEGDRVTQVSLGGLLTVSFAGSQSKRSTGLDQIIMSAQFPAYVLMLKWMTSFRGGTVLNDDEITLLTTTTT
jgi:hypothetical protein